MAVAYILLCWMTVTCELTVCMKFTFLRILGGFLLLLILYAQFSEHTVTLSKSNNLSIGRLHCPTKLQKVAGLPPGEYIASFMKVEKILEFRKYWTCGVICHPWQLRFSLSLAICHVNVIAIYFYCLVSLEKISSVISWNNLLLNLSDF